MRSKICVVVTMMLTTIFIAGCAATYKPPVPLDSSITRTISASRSQIMSVARRILVANGQQIVSADEVSGTISTAFTNHRLTQSQADCGTTLGIDYLLDNRTTTRLSYGLIVDDNKLTVRANIEGEYRPGAVDQNITLTCYSRGLIESNLLDQIVASLTLE